MTNKEKWHKIGDWFLALAAQIKHHKKTLLPPIEIEPSQAIEASVDIWLLEVAKTLKLSVHPSDEIAHWILVRLTAASALSKLLGDKDKEFLESGLTADLIRKMTIEEWHGGMKQAWLQNKKPWFGDS